MIRPCGNCHHVPSRRGVADPKTANDAWCYCVCHDIADVAPGMLVALHRIEDILDGCDDVAGREALACAVEAIAEAKRRPT